MLYLKIGEFFTRRIKVAAPQTHFCIAFLIRVILSFVFQVPLSTWDLISLYFWGALFDFADHFWSLKYAKDIFFVRIPRFLKGGDVGGVSPGVKTPPCWLHLWPGLITIILWTIISYLIFPSFLTWIPISLWLIHQLVDVFQENDGSYPNYPFFYPVVAKNWRKKKGYPIKPRLEVLVATILAGLIVLFEIYSFIK